MPKKTTQRKEASYDQSLGFRSDEDLARAESYLGSASTGLALSQSFFLTSIFGFIISATLMYSGRLGETWGFAFCLVFVMMFIASFISITPKGNDL